MTRSGVGVRHAGVLAAVVGQAIVVEGALAQLRLEKLDMPYMPPTLPTRLSPAPAFPPGSNYQIQVNTNAQGMNILGDAANEPSITVDPTAPNRIMIGWRQFDNVQSNFRQAGNAFSRDGGRSWTNQAVFTPGVFRSDPVVRTDSHGNFNYLSLEQSFNTDIFRSADGGMTFSGPFSAFGGDKEWLAIDRTGSSADGDEYEHYSTAFTRSFTMGTTWQTPVNGTPDWGTSAVGPDGTVFIAGVPCAGCGGPIEVARSANAHMMGVPPSFTTVTVNLGGQQGYGAAPNPGGLLGQVWVVVDTSGGARNGWVYLLCAVSNPAGSSDIMFNRSTDGGQTWLANPVKVNNDPVAAGSWHWFGTLGVAPNGRLDAVWNDTRESQNPTLPRLYYAFSNDGGSTWNGNTALGPQWSSTVGWPQQNKIGDYYDIVSDRVGAFVAYAATYNGEQDVYFLRINAWDCDGNGIPDPVDLAAGTLHDCNGNGIPDECERAAGITVVCTCYPNCDGSTTPPILNVLDFACFLNRFAAGDAWANCDNSTTVPVLNVLDFSCFLNKFAAGCS